MRSALLLFALAFSSFAAAPERKQAQAELLDQNRVDAALVPVIAYQTLSDVRLIPDVCVGAKERVRSVCLVTRGMDLTDVSTVALDVSSRTSVALVKIIFREFLSKEPEYTPAQPNVENMLATADAALIIGDPALSIADSNSTGSPPYKGGVAALRGRGGSFIKYDLAELWKRHTGLGFIFAMWMTRSEKLEIDFAAARDEGVANVDSIAGSYAANLPLSQHEIREYLTQNISYTPDESMLRGMELYFELARKHKLIPDNKELLFV